MLTDIFADRYATRPIWPTYGESESRLLTQCFRIVSEQVMPYFDASGNADPIQKTKWTAVHDKLSMELGLKELSPRVFSYQSTFQGIVTQGSNLHPIISICENFILAKYNGSISGDRFMKERISFIELAFRERVEELKAEGLTLEQRIQFKIITEQRGGIRPLQIPGLPGMADAMRGLHKRSLEQFQASVNELNERLRRSKTDLNYHNGFLQLSTDSLVEKQIEVVFWHLVSDPVWKNVDIDMKEAIDRRDNSDRDPAFYAARALESAIKIISDTKKWTTGAEKGAYNYIDNLGSKKNGSFITEWERDALKAFFTKIRNPIGHGPGSKEMPALTAQQTNWAIETCMSWIKSLIRRM